jgi:parallel beta-helix repeat protein
VAIQDGTLRDWRGDGVQAASATGCRIEDLTARKNGRWGINAGNASRIERCVCIGNGGGIRGGEASIIVNNQCEDNVTSSGITAQLESEVRENICRGNFLSGIVAASGAIITGNICAANGTDGITNDSRCVVQGNEAIGNSQAGVNSARGSFVIGNMVSANETDGIRIISTCKVIGNRLAVRATDVGAEAAAIHVTGSRNLIRENTLFGYPRGLALEGTSNVVDDNFQYGGSTTIDAAPGNDLNIMISELPYTIQHPGMYRLTGDLRILEPDLDGIVIAASNVTLDLMGHAIVGLGSETGTMGSGIFVQDADLQNITVRNGTLQDWRENGVKAYFSANSRFENLMAVQNGLTGIMAGKSAVVSSCQARLNAFGIMAYETSTVRNNVCTENSVYGIDASAECSVLDNVSSRNGSTGIRTGTGSLVTGNHCTRNAGDGIEVNWGSRVFNNDCAYNGYEEADGAGIHVTDNGYDNAIEENLVVGNDRGIEANPSIGNYIARNRATANTTDYDLAGGNTLGSGDLANISY